MTERPLTLFHVPRTRSSGVLALLEELGAPYTLEVLAKDENLSAAYRAINPLGKVPALRDGAAIITEQVAIYIHLADLFPAAGLAPAITDQIRGPYLRWMLFYAAAFEPALVDKARGHEPGRREMSPYGSYDAVIDTLSEALKAGPYLLAAARCPPPISCGAPHSVGTWHSSWCHPGRSSRTTRPASPPARP